MAGVSDEDHVYETPIDSSTVNSGEADVRTGLSNKKGRDGGFRLKTFLLVAIFIALVILIIIAIVIVALVVTNSSGNGGAVSEKPSSNNNLNGPIVVLDQIPANCQEIKCRDSDAISGLYFIRINGTEQILLVYCDQKTEGGGWTLVYSYGFTNYENFDDKSNAVTPIPTWDSSFRTDVEPSTAPPLGEHEKGAVEFKLWKNIGSEFMVKSNINNWITCTSSGGSLTLLKSGGLNCKLIKTVQNCTTSAPNPVPDYILIHIGLWTSPVLIITSNDNLGHRSGYYNWNGDSGLSRPVHDPCGTSNPNHKKNIINPGGAIFLR